MTTASVTSGTNIAVGPSNHLLTAGNYADSWLGLYTATGARNSSRTFTIRQNATRISAVDAQSPATFQTWTRWVGIHELGHALSLADNPVTSSASIMKYPAASSTPYITPRTYDINDVLAIY